MKSIEKALLTIGTIALGDGSGDVYQFWYIRPEIYMRTVKDGVFVRSEVFDNLDKFRLWLDDLPEGFELETPII